MKKPNNSEWTIFGDSNLDYFKIEGDGGGENILRTFGTTEQELVDINHAAHCVNHHNPLTKALEHLLVEVDAHLDYHDDPEMQKCADAAREALNNAKNEEVHLA